MDRRTIDATITECSPWASRRVANAEESVNILDTVCLQPKVLYDLGVIIKLDQKRISFRTSMST